MGEAGAALDLGPPGISGLVDRMTAANLIKRRADPDDGRAWRLWLTPAGRAAMAQSKAGLIEVNARLTPRALREVAHLGQEARTLLTTAAERLGLSARAATRVLRVARTIADLEGEDAVATAHVGEAIGYRTPGAG